MRKGWTRDNNRTFKIVDSTAEKLLTIFETDLGESFEYAVYLHWSDGKIHLGSIWDNSLSLEELQLWAENLYTENDLQRLNKEGEQK